jgi:predicted dinucleotide-binding enzyme
MLEIGVIGAGNVGGTLGRRWAQAGHNTHVGELCIILSRCPRE